MGDLILRAGADSLTGSLDPKLGIIAQRVGCLALDLDTAINGKVPMIEGLENLVETQPRTWKRGEGGDAHGYYVDITLEGHTSPADATGESFDLSGDLSDDPIEAHPDFDLLITNWNGTTDASTGRAKWPTTISAGGAPTNSDGTIQVGIVSSANIIFGGDGAASGETRNLMHGVESYRVPTAIWTRNWVSQRIPHGLLRQLGTLTSSVPGDDAPELTGREQWFCIRITGTKRGNIWQLKQSWQKTGPHGVAPELYRRS